MPIKNFIGTIRGLTGTIGIGVKIDRAVPLPEAFGRVATDAFDVLVWKLDESGSPWSSVGTTSGIQLTKTHASRADPSVITGLFYNALSFPGSPEQHIDQGAGTSTAGELQKLTISAWFLPIVNPTAPNDSPLFVKAASASGSAWADPFDGVGLYVEGGGYPSVRFGANRAGSKFVNINESNMTIHPGEWHHIGATITGSAGITTVKIYFDGQLIKTDTGTTYVGSDPITYTNNGGWSIGGNNNWTLDTFKGYIDDVRLANTVRDATWFTNVWSGGMQALSASGPVTSGLIHRVDAATNVTKDGSNLVSAWGDMSGNGTNWSLSGVNKPEWIPNAVNGLPVIRCTSGGNSGQLEQTSFLAGSDVAEVFVVLKGSPVGGVNYGWGAFGSYTALAAHYPYQGDLYENFGISNTRVSSLGRSTQTTTMNILNISVGTGSSNHVLRLRDKRRWGQVVGVGEGNWVDVDLTSTVTVGWLSPKFYLFRGSNGANQFFGDIGEILIYNRVLTDAERITTRNYLIGKWDL